jgi:hypothetical protein
MQTLQATLLKDIRRLGSVTRSELAKVSGTPIQSVCSAVHALKAQRLVSEKPRRKCVVTGAKAHPIVVTKKGRTA